MNLTPYESQVVTLLGKGEIPKRIATKLQVSDEAVYSCVKNINKKAKRSGYRWARVLVRVSQ